VSAVRDYVIVSPSELWNYVSADKQENRVCAVPSPCPLFVWISPRFLAWTLSPTLNSLSSELQSDAEKDTERQRNGGS
jgi:hypothetical protein